MPMDWYSWLSKSGLEPELAYEYSLVFARNELDSGDVKHFDHEFLLSMGVSVGKHRLEILKLAKKEKAILPLQATRLLAAVVHRSKRSLAKYMCSIVHRDKSAFIVVPQPRPSYDMEQWKSALLKRRRKLALLKHLTKPMITYGIAGTGRINTTDKAVAACCVSPVVYCYDEQEEMEVVEGGEEMRWESMFQDLKPT